MRQAIFLSGVFLLSLSFASQVFASQLVSVECQDKTCWTSQSIRSDINLSLVPGESVLETWQVSNESDQTTRLFIKVTDKSSQKWADQPLQLAVNGEDIDFETWFETEQLQFNTVVDVNLQVRLDARADNSWQNHLWQLEVELVAEPLDLKLVGESGAEIETMSVLSDNGNERVLGTGLAPESIKSSLSPLDSPWQFALIGLLIPLFLVLMAYWFVKSRQSTDN